MPHRVEWNHLYRRPHQTEWNTAVYAAPSGTEDQPSIPRAAPGRTEHCHEYCARHNRRPPCTDAAPGGTEDRHAPMPRGAERRDNDTTPDVRKDTAKVTIPRKACERQRYHAGRVISSVLFFCDFLGARIHLRGIGLGGGQGGAWALHCAATRGLRSGNELYILLAMIYLGRMRVMNKPKKKEDVSAINLST